MAKTKLKFDELHPFRSYLFAAISGGFSLGKAIERSIRGAREIICAQEGYSILQASDTANTGGVQAAFLHYQVERPATWTANPNIMNRSHELVMAIGFKKHLTIYCSDNWLKSSVRRQITAGTLDSFAGFDLVDEDILNAAFVAGKSSQTLWLSGTHRRTTSKADNKVLSGSDLRFALDPLGDQTFFYTAARARTALTSSSDPEPIGLAPRKSAAWLGLARNWPHHRDTAKSLINLIVGADTSEEPPLPVLASAAPSDISVEALGKAYDAAFMPPEMLETTASSEDRDALEHVFNLGLEVDSDASGRVILRIPSEGDQESRASIELNLDLSNPQRITWAIEPPESSTRSVEIAAGVLRRHPAWLKMWFDSGYVLADRTLFRTRHRDLPFDGWRWCDFSGHNIKKEKPDPLQAENIGHDDSLFCWVAKQETFPWAPNSTDLGWLASNDGSMEIADFIHVDPTEKLLSLIHVKGAGSASQARRVSVSSYEVVVGQAIKNLRHVDHELLSGGFLNSLDRRLKAAVWKDGRFLGEAARDRMKTAIADMGANFARQIVILQPHIRRASLEASRQATTATARLPAQQLDTLLLGARASCQAVGAELIVIGEDA